MYDLFDSMGEHPTRVHARDDRRRAGLVADVLEQNGIETETIHVGT